MKEKFENFKGAEMEKEKREIAAEEVEKMGEEMDEYFMALKKEAEEIEKELAGPGISEERRRELQENLDLIKEQLGEDWEDFVKDIKSGEWSEAKIDE